MTLPDTIEQLYSHQLATWPLAQDNYKELDNILTRNIHFVDHLIRLQFNPKRIISSSAKVDPQSISERPCFLCSKNRPTEQKGIPYRNDYLLLINPYPVFRRHLTIPTIDHLPQRITNHFSTMLSLASDLQDYTIIYNGPNCGASAPDHFHFQAIGRNHLPVEREYRMKLTGKIELFKNIELYSLSNYHRRVLTIIGNDESGITEVFSAVFRILLDTLPAADEPMMNVLTWHEQSNWIIHIFPRKQHRPSQYFETGDKQILLSPASIDMGGVLIMPRDKDYEKVTKDDVSDILDHVCVDDFFVSVLMNRLKKEL
jgi:hypothetical protein